MQMYGIHISSPDSHKSAVSTLYGATAVYLITYIGSDDTQRIPFTNSTANSKTK